MFKRNLEIPYIQKKKKKTLDVNKVYIVVSLQGHTWKCIIVMNMNILVSFNPIYGPYMLVYKAFILFS